MRCTGKMVPPDENLVNAHSQHRQNFSSGPGTSNFWTVVAVLNLHKLLPAKYWSKEEKVPFFKVSQGFAFSRRLTPAHTILFTCRFQNTACRLPNFHRTHSSNALLFVVVAKKMREILATVRIKLYDGRPKPLLTMFSFICEELCLTGKCTVSSQKYIKKALLDTNLKHAFIAKNRTLCSSSYLHERQKASDATHNVASSQLHLSCFIGRWCLGAALWAPKLWLNFVNKLKLEANNSFFSREKM